MNCKILIDNPPTLSEAQKAVGGYVEVVELRDGRQMLVNEEGLPKGLPPNKNASLIANQMILGNVLILDGDAKWTE
jgi:hypothetical protein